MTVGSRNYSKDRRPNDFEVLQATRAMARPRRFLALLTAAICSAWPTPFEDPQLPAQVPQADAPRRTRPKLLSVGGLRSSQVAIFLLNTPMVAWDPNADPNGQRRKPDGGDTGAGRWKVGAPQPLANLLGTCGLGKSSPSGA